MFQLEEAHEFVDYYALLEVSPTASANELRKRIFELYDEARQNLDHRNHRKRFYYTTLYETHLSRARHFLLDDERRKVYDNCLRAYKAGQPFDFAALFEAAKGPDGATPAAAPAAAVATTTVAPPRPPAPTTAPQARTAPPAQTTPKPPASAPVQPRAQAQPAAPAPAAKPAAAQPTPGDRMEKLLRTPTLLVDPEDIERRRDYRRRELIGTELRSRSRAVFAITMAVLTIIGTLFLPPLQNALVLAHKEPEPTLSATDYVLIVMAFLLICGVASTIGWQASRFARRQIIGSLSRMTYDDLLRHCRH